MPTYNHGRTIEYAVASILTQTIQDFELFIVGDGVPNASKPLIQSLVNTDSRIRFFDFPKHIRRGEPNRHLTLQEASGEIVCYMCDRDLWLPSHLENMQALLLNADFAHSLPLHVLPMGKIKFYPCDLALPVFRQFMLSVQNLVPFSCAAHKMDFYHRLPEGWTTAPGKNGTDWYMFKKFLAIEECRTVSGFFPSAITFPSPIRIDWSEDQRIQELEVWLNKLKDSKNRNKLILDIMQQVVKENIFTTAKWMSESNQLETINKLARTLDNIYCSPTWRLRDVLIRTPGLKALVNFFT
jgi:glycosyltransferase involved in cell wall biosynthesis